MTATVDWLLDPPPTLREQLDSDLRFDGRFDYRRDDDAIGQYAGG